MFIIIIIMISVFATQLGDFGYFHISKALKFEKLGVWLLAKNEAA